MHDPRRPGCLGVRTVSDPCNQVFPDQAPLSELTGDARAVALARLAEAVASYLESDAGLQARRVSTDPCCLRLSVDPGIVRDRTGADPDCAVNGVTVLYAAASGTIPVWDENGNQMSSTIVVQFIPGTLSFDEGGDFFRGLGKVLTCDRLVFGWSLP